MAYISNSVGPPGAAYTTGGRAIGDPTPQSTQVPYISQWDGSTSQKHDCGPTVMAMVARANGEGQGLTDAQLVQQMRADRGSHVLPGGGTRAEGMSAIGQALGVPVQEIPHDRRQQIVDALRSGKVVAAEGDSCSLPGHENKNKRVGHWILIVGMTPDGKFIVRDPAHKDVTTLTWAQLQTFLNGTQKKGGQPGLTMAIGWKGDPMPAKPAPGYPSNDTFTP